MIALRDARERAIWDATYAAACVRMVFDFKEHYDFKAIRLLGKKEKFSDALALATSMLRDGENAAFVADLAVYHFRKLEQKAVPRSAKKKKRR